MQHGQEEVRSYLDSRRIVVAEVGSSKAGPYWLLIRDV